MTNFKAKGLISNLLALMMIAVFFTACTQKDTTAVDALNEATMTQKLADDASFQKLQRIQRELILSADLENTTLENRPMISEAELASLTSDILNNIPELKKMEQASLEKVISGASEMIQKTVAYNRSCPGCNECVAGVIAAYLGCDNVVYGLYLQGVLTYNEYLAANRDCVETVYNPLIVQCPCSC